MIYFVYGWLACVGLVIVIYWRTARRDKDEAETYLTTMRKIVPRKDQKLEGK